MAALNMFTGNFLSHQEGTYNPVPHRSHMEVYKVNGVTSSLTLILQPWGTKKTLWRSDGNVGERLWSCASSHHLFLTLSALSGLNMTRRINDVLVSTSEYSRETKEIFCQSLFLSKYIYDLISEHIEISLMRFFLPRQIKLFLFGKSSYILSYILSIHSLNSIL